MVDFHRSKMVVYILIDLMIHPLLNCLMKRLCMFHFYHLNFGLSSPDLNNTHANLTFDIDVFNCQQLVTCVQNSYKKNTEAIF